MRREGKTKLRIPAAKPAAPDRLNVWTCMKCGFQIVCIDIHEGCTPFALDCKADGCDGTAYSHFYHVAGMDFGAPQWEWYTPQFAEYINLSTPERDHVYCGGLLLRRRVREYAAA